MGIYSHAENAARNKKNYDTTLMKTKYNTDNPYHIERAQKAEVYQAQIKAIAEALGATYVPHRGELWEGGDQRGAVQLSTGQVIGLRKTWGAQRITVSGHWPKDSKNTTHTPQSYNKSGSGYKDISVSLERPAEAIAKDIQRRFIPAFLKEHAYLTDQTAKSNQYLARRNGNVSRLAALANVKNAGEQGFHLDLPTGWGDVEISSGTATFKLHSLTIEQAEQVLKLINTFTAPEGKE